MSYDLEAVDPPTPQEQAAWEAAKSRWRALNQRLARLTYGSPEYEALQAQLGEAAGAVAAADTARHRMAGLSMSWARQALLVAGAVHVEGEEPAWPNDLPWEEWQVQLRWRPADVPGIPIWKLSSTIGWHVTGTECREAVERWRQNRHLAVEAAPGIAAWEMRFAPDDPCAGGDRVIEITDRFVAWMEKVKDRGGFRVW